MPHPSSCGRCAYFNADVPRDEPGYCLKGLPTATGIATTGSTMGVRVIKVCDKGKEEEGAHENPR